MDLTNRCDAPIEDIAVATNGCCWRCGKRLIEDLEMTGVYYPDLIKARLVPNTVLKWAANNYNKRQRGFYNRIIQCISNSLIECKECQYERGVDIIEPDDLNPNIVGSYFIEEYKNLFKQMNEPILDYKEVLYTVIEKQDNICHTCNKKIFLDDIPMPVLRRRNPNLDKNINNAVALCPRCNQRASMAKDVTKGKTRFVYGKDKKNKGK